MDSLIKRPLLEQLYLCQMNSLPMNFLNQLFFYKKRRVYLSFKYNIWGADLANMQLISKLHKGIRFLLCVIDILSKHAWSVRLKDKKGITIVSAFRKVLNKSDYKPN